MKNHDGTFATILLVGILASAIAMIQLPSMLVPARITNSIDWKPAKINPTESMKAISYSNHGNVTVLNYDTNYPKPIPRDDQVLIQVKASSVNPVDFKFRRNSIIPFSWILPKPKIPGADIAGVIVEVGGGSNNNNEAGGISSSASSPNNLKVGDHVVAMMPLLGSRWGANAEYAAVDTAYVAKIIPDDTTTTTTIDYESAASLPLVSLTVIQSLEKIESPTKGKKILIHAGGGGVGTFAIQYAKHVLGMYVATTASKEKANFLSKTLGADLVIDYRTQDFTTIVKDYDAVLDTMSFLYETKTLKANILKKTGKYLNILSSDWSLTKDGREASYGPMTMWNFCLHKIANIFLPAVLPKYDFCVVVPDGAQLQLTMDLLHNGTIQSVVEKVFPLSKLAEAHSLLEKGHVTGKIVLCHDN